MHTIKWMFAGFLALGLVFTLAGGSLAHKGKLPQDALTLVRQASALLAQNPKMVREARERLEAALKSKKPEGVNLSKVAEALQALKTSDIPTARRLLAESTIAAGPPKPPQGPRRTAIPVPPPSTQPVPVEQPAEVAMKMSEPLRSQFTGSAVEVAILVVGLVSIGVGLVSLWRSREGVQL
ncbi:MAG: hypothetical protein QN198_01450 [Armatimonadota bacterium]|nr:hypothetical protein [Armatimonadota bacterium]MDR5702250.1 hypothetical protein [Armatimonadota bacterium]